MTKTLHAGLAAALLAACAAAGATDLRGRVDGKAASSGSTFPLGGTALKLYRQDAGQTRLAGSAFTGPNGMYYFRAVAPGRYVLQVHGRSFPVQVGSAQLQDVPPLVIPR
jgi:hypothetical protein